MSPQRDDILRFLKENKPHMRDAIMLRASVFRIVCAQRTHRKSDIDLIVEFEDDTRIFTILKTIYGDTSGSTSTGCRYLSREIY